MPIKIPSHLPAIETLLQENIFAMDNTRAFHQDIRPLEIVILNLMPTKETTETQLLRLLGNTPLQINITLLYLETHISKNTSMEHIFHFYTTHSEIKNNKFDGFIITGAPIEHLPFEDVSYWQELREIMEWSKTNVTSTFHICWAAQAGLYYHYNIPKYHLPQKLFGVFSHTINDQKNMLMRGFDDEFFAPHSRHTEITRNDIEHIEALDILSESADAGIYIVASKDKKQVFITGHSEYDPNTLKEEYFRDKNKGLDTLIPKNYFKNDDEQLQPIVRWRAHAHILFTNWLNYYVYQETPYDL